MTSVSHTPIDFDKLKEPFSSKDIEWRPQGKPYNDNVKVLAYVDARAVQDRLDEVCGPDNWTATYQHIPNKGVMCSLAINCGGRSVMKQDGSPETDIESFKGGISKALVRTASVWGVGRYLYKMPETWVTLSSQRGPASIYCRVDGRNMYFTPPSLPDWALPKDERGRAQSSPTREVEQETMPQSAPSQATAPKKQQYETAPASKPSSGPLSEYVIQAGKKFAGQRLVDLDTEAYQSYINWAEGDAAKKGKPLSFKMQKDFEMFRQFHDAGDMDDINAQFSAASQEMTEDDIPF